MKKKVKKVDESTLDFNIRLSPDFNHYIKIKMEAKDPSEKLEAWLNIANVSYLWDLKRNKTAVRLKDDTTIVVLMKPADFIKRLTT